MMTHTEADIRAASPAALRRMAIDMLLDWHAMRKTLDVAARESRALTLGWDALRVLADARRKEAVRAKADNAHLRECVRVRDEWISWQCDLLHEKNGGAGKHWCPTCEDKARCPATTHPMEVPR